MPTNNFKLFDQNKANLLSDTEYLNATQRLNGVQTGVASSQIQNKFAYQVSLVAYAVAQIMNQNGLDASDTLAVSAFVGNLGGSLLQKVADKASSAEAAAGVLTNKYISPATMKAAALLLSGGVMTGTLDMNNNKITNLPTPTSSSEPATKEYVDGNAGHKELSESLNISGRYSGTEIKKNLTKNIDLNNVDSIGIRVTYNNGLIINTKHNSSFNFSFNLKDTSFSIFNFYEFYGNFAFNYAQAGDSYFIPIFLYPVLYSYLRSSNTDYKTGIVNGVIRSGSTKDLSLTTTGTRILDTSCYFSIGGSSDITTNNFNITLDIYKIYF